MKLAGTLLLLIIIVLVAVTLLCHIIALVTHFWLRSSDTVRTNFLNLGLWVACFDNFEHIHENPRKTYSGCYDIYSEHYSTIRDWLIPCMYELGLPSALSAPSLHLPFTLSVCHSPCLSVSVSVSLSLPVCLSHIHTLYICIHTFICVCAYV